MATYSNLNLISSKFMDPVTYKVGKGKLTKEEQIYNFFDNKLMFLDEVYSCYMYTLPSKNFLPNISVKFYGTSSLWWVIARYNGIMYPLKEIEAGITLKIPEMSAITKAINNAQNKTSTGSSHQKVLL